MSHPLQIKPLETKATKEVNPPMMEAIGLKHPFSMGIFGLPGSGKTILCCQLLCNKNLFYQYFDKIYLFSHTARTDDTFKHLGIPDDQIFSDNMIEELDKIIQKQKPIVEDKGILESDRICCVFEDLTANTKLMRSKPFIQTFVEFRHFNMSPIAVCHSYKSLIKVCRISTHNKMFFPCNQTESECIREDNQVYGMCKNNFNAMLKEAFTPEPDNSHPFLHINNKVPAPIRFRKSLTTILNFYDDCKEGQDEPLDVTDKEPKKLKDEEPQNPIDKGEKQSKMEYGHKLIKLVNEYKKTKNKKLLPIIAKLTKQIKNIK